jgi:hypothetical protein
MNRRCLSERAEDRKRERVKDRQSTEDRRVEQTELVTKRNGSLSLTHREKERETRRERYREPDGDKDRQRGSDTERDTETERERERDRDRVWEACALLWKVNGIH